MTRDANTESRDEPGGVTVHQIHFTLAAVHLDPDDKFLRSGTRSGKRFVEMNMLFIISYSRDSMH